PHTQTHVYIHTRTYTHPHTHTHTDSHSHTYLYTYIRAHVGTHTHTQARLCSDRMRYTLSHFPQSLWTISQTNWCISLVHFSKLFKTNSTTQWIASKSLSLTQNAPFMSQKQIITSMNL